MADRLEGVCAIGRDQCDLLGTVVKIIDDTLTFVKDHIKWSNKKL